MTEAIGTETRIALRVDPQQKELIERGAAARGLTVTDYVKTLAIRDAQKVLTERTFFTLDPEAFAAFAAILDRPPQPKTLLVRQIQKARNSNWKRKS